MIKLTLSVFATVLCVFFLSSCNNPNPTDNTSQSSSNSSSSLSTSLSTPTDDYPYFKSQIEGFLTALKSKNVEQLGLYLNVNDTRAYEFFNSVNIESYSIVDESQLDDDNIRYTIELNITSSVSALFPVGRSQWEVNVNASFFITYFQPVGKTINIDYRSEDILFCMRFSSVFNYFGTTDDLNDMVPDPNNSIWYNQFCGNLLLFLNNQLTYGENGVSAEQVLAVSKKVLGITALDLTKYNNYNNLYNTVYVDGRGYPFYFNSLSSRTYDPQTKRSTLTIDYYTDSGYLLKGKTVEYVIRENDDKSYTLISVKKIYDTGYELSSDGV